MPYYSDEEIQRMLDSGEILVSGKPSFPGETLLQSARRMLRADYPISSTMSMDNPASWPRENQPAVKPYYPEEKK